MELSPGGKVRVAGAREMLRAISSWLPEPQEDTGEAVNLTRVRPVRMVATGESSHRDAEFFHRHTYVAVYHSLAIAAHQPVFVACYRKEQGLP